MATLLVLSPALSYAQQSDADLVRSLDSAMYYFADYGNMSDVACVTIDGQQAIVFMTKNCTEVDTGRLCQSRAPIVGRRFRGTGRYPMGDGEARINADTIVVDISNGTTRVFLRATCGECNWTQR